MTHKHWFTLLWWNLGQFGRQDVHIHSCIEDKDGVSSGCDRVIVGEGRTCGGMTTPHKRKNLGQPWSERTKEGTPI